MDDFSKRLGEVEKAVVGIGTKLETALPQLATKADLQSVRVEIGAVRGDVNAMETRMVAKVAAIETKLETALPTVATKADVKALEARLAAEIGDTESRIIKWTVATLISGMALAGAVAQLLSRL
jgi:phage host-nuclease inhibitor protein Gam